MSFEQVFETFGGQANVWHENQYWAVLIRPKQVTLGASVLMPKRSLLSIGELTPEELIGLGAICRDLEAALSDRFQFDKINYLMLAMKDPLLHFHVIPRYESPKEFAGITWEDSAWPKPPALGEFVDDAQAVAQVRDTLRIS